VEELEDRIGHKMDEILSLVQTSIGPPAPERNVNGQINSLPEQVVLQPVEQSEWNVFGYDDDDVDAIGEEEQFDDTGEGIGIEGDLEMDEN
jgi:hypothetical protein